MLYAFDVYGTLFDVNSIVEEVGNMELVNEWRRKQLEYSWLLTIMNRYESFWEITRKALMHAMKKFNVSLDVNKVMRAWLNLKPFEDVIEALPKIKARKVTLTNGDEWMVRELLKNSNLLEYFDEMIAAERVKKYKPAREVYKLVEGAIFISSNPWDIAGAHNAGLSVIYINRYGYNLEEIDIGGELKIIKSLRELL
ncbi:haloacid dehalogenase type II [Sulfolobus sp. E5-1-F]|uniref:haloacid dehalogenase type II n=1 Tax=Sulfolobaceae TaxID=118883 RepID=UPI00129678A3|nr:MULTISPECIES: haloacid dehalogenase type II [unclassified Sulfolobus]QGA53796.1 haloacid dehalogenase type II [Sulfolobus sp. E5-1-F]QGA68548.1 haloacid dehalogenase type II [Sulfolobus sp. E11-6]